MARPPVDGNGSALLTAHQPLRLDLRVGLDTARTATRSTLLLGTEPAGDPQWRGRGLLVSVVGVEQVRLAGDRRPWLAGFFSDVAATSASAAGISGSAEVDDRFESAPTPLKTADADLPGAADGFTGAATAVLVAGCLLAAPTAVCPARWRLLARLTRPARWFAAASGAALLLVFGTVAVVTGHRAGTYTIAHENVRSVRGGTCGLADWTMVEADPAAGLLPVRDDGTSAADSFARGAGTPAGVDAPAFLGGLWWGSFGGSDATTGTLASSWYALAGRPRDVPLVLALAGTLTGGNDAEIMVGRAAPAAGGPFWGATRCGTTVRRSRTGTTSGSRPARSTSPAPTRSVSSHRTGRPEWMAGWLAVGAPRVPVLAPLTAVVPVSQPVLVDWTSAASLPCHPPIRLDQAWAPCRPTRSEPTPTSRCPRRSVRWPRYAPSPTSTSCRPTCGATGPASGSTSGGSRPPSAPPRCRSDRP